MICFIIYIAHVSPRPTWVTEPDVGTNFNQIQAYGRQSLRVKNGGQGSVGEGTHTTNLPHIFIMFVPELASRFLIFSFENGTFWIQSSKNHHLSRILGIRKSTKT